MVCRLPERDNRHPDVLPDVPLYGADSPGSSTWGRHDWYQRGRGAAGHSDSFHRFEGP